MAKLRIGIIGGGGIANGAHLPVLSKRLDQIELAGVADVDPEAARATAEKWGIARQETDYHDLLPDVDAVFVCVPTHVHSEITVAALSAGKHVFCEKPIARTRAQAEAMRDAAASGGASLQIGFVRRFDDEWLAFRTAVQESRIGRPVVWRDVQSHAGPWQRAWYTQDEQGGGPFLDGCIHNLDFALFTFGPAEWAFTHGRTLRTGNTAIDTGTATVHFASGDELLLAWSWGLPPDCSGGRVFELLGPQGTLTWPRDGEKGATERHFAIHDGTTRQTVAFPADALTQAFARQVDEFLAVAQGKARPRAGADEGIAAFDVALAILESGRSGQPVAVRSAAG